MSNKNNPSPKEKEINFDSDEVAIFLNMLNKFGKEVNRIQNNYNKLTESKFFIYKMIFI